MYSAKRRFRLFRHPAFASSIPTFDTLTLARSGAEDAFVTKYTDTGRINWATRIGGIGSDIGYSISVDSGGNTYVIGSYASNPITIFNADGSTFGTLANSGSSDVFIVKYNTSGTVQWGTRISGGAGDFGYSISVDSDGNTYVTGQYVSIQITIFNADGTTFGTVANPGSRDVFIVKYNTSGTAQWATRIGGTGSDQGYSISVDSGGNAYVTGEYGSNPITILNANGTTFGTLANSGSNDAFIVKYNTSGVVQWASRLAGIGSDSGSGISVDSGGNAYVTGRYSSNPLTMFNANGTSFGTLANSGVSDAYIVKYNTSGTIQWATRIGGTGSENANGISVDNSGNAYVTGDYSVALTIFNADGTTFGTVANPGSIDAYIVKYDTSGTAQWATRIGGIGSDIGYSISVDSEGNTYVTGQYTSNPINILNANGTTFGTLANSGSSDVFIVKYNTSGTAQWATRIDGTGDDLGYGISVSGTNVAVIGFYSSNPLTLRSVGF